MSTDFKDLLVPTFMLMWQQFSY